MVLEIDIIFKSGEELVSNSPQEKISDNQTEITTIGLWIEAFGTFLSAIGNTPISAVNHNLLFDIDRVGDVLQLSGTTIQIEDEKNWTLNKYGNIVIAGGTSEEIYANFRPDRGSEIQEQIYSQSTAIQAVGTALALADSLEQSNSTIEICNVYANSLQVIGLSIESISSIYENEQRENFVNSVGHWIQFSGAALAAICHEKTNPYFSKYTLDNTQNQYSYSYYFLNH